MFIYSYISFNVMIDLTKNIYIFFNIMLYIAVGTHLTTSTSDLYVLENSKSFYF